MKMNADLILKVDSAFMEHRPKNSSKHKHIILDKKSKTVVTNNKTRDAENSHLIYIVCFLLNLCLISQSTMKLTEKLQLAE